VGDDANFEPVAKVTTVPWPGNAEGEAVYTRPTMAKFIVEDGDLPEMKEKASEALEAAGFPKTDRGKVEAILAFARNVMSYVPDSPMRQTCYRPRYMVCAQGAKLCVRIGNCVNMNCALGALLRAAGFDVKVQGIEYGGGAQDHVNILVKLPDERNLWAEADATTNAPVGYVSLGRKLVYDPLNPAVTGAGVAGGAFIGAGRPMEAITTREALFGRSIGAGLVTPGDILAYRAAWDQYVTDTCRVAIDCGTVFQNQAGSATLNALGTQYIADGNNLLAKWNKWSTLSSSSLVLQGATVLQDFQQTVLECGAERATLIAGPVPCSLSYVNPQGVVVAAAPGADPSLQVQIIARIEGLGLLASGILQILVQGAGDVLVAAGSATQYAAKLAGSTASWILSPWTWAIAGTLLVGTVVVVVYNADKVAKIASSVAPFAAEPRKLRRRRKRRKIGP